jgi:putative membrane protein
VNRQAQGVLLFVAGGTVLRTSFTDLYLRYVKAGLRPLLLLTGIILIVAALATFWYELRAARAARRSPSGQAAREGHTHREPRVAWLVVLPVLALIAVLPPALGSYTADRTGTALQAPAGFAKLPAGDPVRLSVADYAERAVYDHGHSLANRRVKLTGFITVAGRGEPILTRMILNCCAADALPIKVGLSGRVPSGLRPDTWLEVVGTSTATQIRDDVNNGPIPFIDVSEARPIPAPAGQYES